MQEDFYAVTSVGPHDFRDRKVDTVKKSNETTDCRFNIFRILVQRLMRPREKNGTVALLVATIAQLKISSRDNSFQVDYSE